MASFAAPVASIRAIEPIPGADMIELAVVADYRSVVKKGQFKPGDLAVYLPEASVLPDWMIEALGLTGKLAGSKKNRIKAVRLRGCLSQGILYPVEICEEPDNVGDSGKNWYFVNVQGEHQDYLIAESFDRDTCIKTALGQDMAEILGVTKYEPPIPTTMRGDVCSLHGSTLSYDIENLKAWPDVLVEGEPVVFTEKIHGTHLQIGVVPGLDYPEIFEGNCFVASKGLGAKGLVFKDTAANAGNIYVMAYKAQTDADGRTLRDRILEAARTIGIDGLSPDAPIYVLGEIFGQSIQDLTYGQSGIALRGFDVYAGHRDRGRFLDDAEKDRFFAAIGIERVPVLYRGPWSRAVADAHCDGRTTVPPANGTEKGGAPHIREGIVITPVSERRDNTLGRVILKHVSGDYLTRKGGTDFT